MALRGRFRVQSATVGLQNRLWGGAEPSQVGSIPIHPRQGFSEAIRGRRAEGTRLPAECPCRTGRAVRRGDRSGRENATQGRTMALAESASRSCTSTWRRERESPAVGTPSAPCGCWTGTSTALSDRARASGLHTRRNALGPRKWVTLSAQSQGCAVSQHLDTPSKAITEAVADLPVAPATSRCVPNPGATAYR